MNAMISLHVSGPTKADKVEIVSTQYVSEAEGLENDGKSDTE